MDRANLFEPKPWGSSGGPVGSVQCRSTYGDVCGRSEPLHRGDSDSACDGVNTFVQQIFTVSSTNERPMDRRTPHGVRSAPVHRLCDADGARASGAAQKSRRHAMSRNEEFVTDGGPPRGATSLKRMRLVRHKCTHLASKMAESGLNATKCAVPQYINTYCQ